MRIPRGVLVLLILAINLLWACASGGGFLTTPTRSSEAVIGTAQGFAELTREATIQTLPPTPVTSSATSPPSTPTSTPSPTLGAPFITANYNVRVRAGPDESYAFVDIILEGQRGRVVGRFENPGYNPPTWWYIRRIGVGKDGWIWSGAVTLSGDASLAPVIQVSPTPEED